MTKTPSQIASISPVAFKSAMRRLPAAVNIVTAALDGVYYGFTATAVCSLSAEPPSLVACVNRTSRSYRAIHASRAFAVNVLDAEHEDLARTFAFAEPADRSDRFRSVQWSRLVSGSPVLARAVVAFDCALVREIEYATHSILIGSVVAIEQGDCADNLVYCKGEFSKLRPAMGSREGRPAD